MKLDLTVDKVTKKQVKSSTVYVRNVLLWKGWGRIGEHQLFL